MSATRLLVLGAIRIMQPVHGYEVRRELVSWRLEETTNVRPGSIYGAMRTLEKEARQGGGGGPPRGPGGGGGRPPPGAHDLRPHRRGREGVPAAAAGVL